MLFGNKVAGGSLPQLVIAWKRNGAYADDIQPLALDCMSCLKVENHRRKQTSVITDQIECDGRKKNYG